MLIHFRGYMIGSRAIECNFDLVVFAFDCCSRGPVIGLGISN